MRIPSLWRVACLLALALPVAAQDLLHNGDFEAGGKLAVDGWTSIWPRGLQDPPPDFEHPERDAHGGKRCGLLTTHRPGGFSSFTQELRRPPRDVNLARLSGWVRVDELGPDSFAALLLVFWDPERPDETLGIHYSRRLRQAGDWVRVEVEAPIPEGTQAWIVRCGILGQGRAAFDDVELVATKEAGGLTSAELSVHHGEFLVRAQRKTRAPWIALSIPFPFERQTPLALRVESDPPGAVASLEVLEERENRPLKVVLHPQERGAEVKLRVETLTLVVDRPLSDGAGVALADPRKAPREVRQHLQRAPGVDVTDKRVRERSRRFSKDDLRALMLDLVGTLRDDLDYTGGASQGARECLESGQAVCTGYANVAASLLIASDVPTRILACTQRSGRLQEHYIVEAWTPALGWSRVESTMARFPWRDSENLVLRVVYPDSERSPFDVPLYVESGGGADGRFDLSPEDTCWQGAEEVGSFRLGAEPGPLEEAPPEANEHQRDTPPPGASVRLAPLTSLARELELSEREERILQEVDAWIGR